ncbi:MAG: carbohydrate ABC transporter permease [Halothermotrichaceae bacterium]
MFLRLKNKMKPIGILKKNEDRISNDSTIREKAFYIFINIFVALFTIACFIPFWVTVLASFTPEMTLAREGLGIIPRGFSLEAYKFILQGNQIYYSYGVTIIVTVIGTLLGVLVNAPFAYVLYHPRVKYRYVISFITYFTMVFGAGIVGFYILVAQWLGLRNNILAMILPDIFNPFMCFLLVAFYRGLPFELNESARLEGASELQVFRFIILPISKPIIATISLFIGLGYWNSWFEALLFIDNSKLLPLQLLLRQMISNINVSNFMASEYAAQLEQVLPSTTVRFATVCLTIGPIFLAYPFIQKYFVKGITIGAIKG